MIFNSLQFLIFLPLVIMLYYATPYKWRWVLLLTASYYFYMCWKAEYAFIIVLSTSIDYFCGLKMAQYEDKKDRRKFMLLSVIMNLSILFVFKYFNFFSDSTRDVFNNFNIFYNTPQFRLFLPVGLSFYTFQAISYTVDVYRGTTKAETHFGYFATFVSYWPQLVAGPIQRKENFLPQLKQNFDFDYDRARKGFVRILWGFFKKVVIADRLSIFVQQVYQHPGQHGGFAVILATWLFAFQVYCDFSGYCDIAIGSAKMMGHNLVDNFKTPYFSKTVREFWQRWHITLSVWIRDYLYFPLGGSRVRLARLVFNTMLTFTLMGLWHGANWTFVLFGVIHGILLSVRRVTDKLFPNFKLNLGPRLKWLTSFLAMFWVFNLTSIPDIFFSSKSVADAFTQIRSIFTVPDTTIQLIHNSLVEVDSVVQFVMSIVFLAIFIYFDYRMYLNNDQTIEDRITAKPLAVRWSFYIVFLVFIAWFGWFSQTAFIYFQF